MKRTREALREVEPVMRLARMQDMAEHIVYVESAEQAVAALRERGMGGSAARTLVQGALESQTFSSGLYRLYALAAAVAAAAAVSSALIALH
jgi:hypothetical protein